MTTSGTKHEVRRSRPYAWPYNGDLRPENTALIIIDRQTDFCGKGGYVDTMGYDLSLTRAPIEPIRARARRRCARQVAQSSTPARGTAPTSSDLPANKLWRSQRIGAGIGDNGPCGRDPRARRAGLGHHPECRAAARRADHRQAGQGLVLRHRPRPDAAARAASPTSCSPASRPTSACTPPCARPTTAATSASCCRTAPAPPTTATTRPRSRW